MIYPGNQAILFNALMSLTSGGRSADRDLDLPRREGGCRKTSLASCWAKCIAPALRVSYLLAPDPASEQKMRSNLQATMLMPAPLMVALVTYWLRFGIADMIILAIRNEAIGRQQLAHRFLKGVSYAAKPNGHHLCWLPLPPQWNRAEFLSHVLRHGVAVVGDDAFAV